MISKRRLINAVSLVLSFHDSIKPTQFNGDWTVFILSYSCIGEKPGCRLMCLINCKISYSLTWESIHGRLQNQFIHNSFRNFQQRQVHDICNNCQHQEMISSQPLLTTVVSTSAFRVRREPIGKGKLIIFFTVCFYQQARKRETSVECNTIEI